MYIQYPHEVIQLQNLKHKINTWTKQAFQVVPFQIPFFDFEVLFVNNTELNGQHCTLNWNTLGPVYNGFRYNEHPAMTNSFSCVLLHVVSGRPYIIWRQKHINTHRSDEVVERLLLAARRVAHRLGSRSHSRRFHRSRQPSDRLVFKYSTNYRRENVLLAVIRKYPVLLIRRTKYNGKVMFSVMS